MVRRFNDSEIDPTVLDGKRVAMIGYGSQGRGQALNLRDSGIDVCLGLRETGHGWNRAVDEGWRPLPIEEACGQADLIALMTPDLSHGTLFSDRIQPHLKQPATLLFAHGFSVHFKTLVVPEQHNVVMVAPKGPGATVRSLYQDGKGVAALIAVHQDATGEALDLALAYGWAIGAARIGLLQTTFAEESETDLFSEQAILCGGLPELILAGWETLVEAGYQPEIAYFECLHEVKLIADLLYAGGMSRMYRLISETAAYGGLVNGDRVIGPSAREAMKEILAEIRSGKFARQWADSSRTDWREMIATKLQHPIEEVGRRVRKDFS
jgi:ketol-acid reductoisomerase